MIAFPYAEGAGIARLLPRAPVPAPDGSWGAGNEIWFAFWRGIAEKYGHPNAGTVENSVDLSTWLNQVKDTAMAQAAEDRGGSLDSGFVVRFDSLMTELSHAWFLSHGTGVDPSTLYDAQLRSALASAPAGAIIEYGAKLTALDSGAYAFTEPLRMAAVPAVVEPPPALLNMTADNPSVPAAIAATTQAVSVVTPVVLNTSIPNATHISPENNLQFTAAGDDDAWSKIAKLWLPLAAVAVVMLVLRKRGRR